MRSASDPSHRGGRCARSRGSGKETAARLTVGASRGIAGPVAGLQQEILPSTEVNWISARYRMAPGG